MEKVREIEESESNRVPSHPQEIYTKAGIQTQDYDEDRSDEELTDLMGDFSEQTGALFG